MRPKEATCVSALDLFTCLQVSIIWTCVTEDSVSYSWFPCKFVAAFRLCYSTEQYRKVPNPQKFDSLTLCDVMWSIIQRLHECCLLSSLPLGIRLLDRALVRPLDREELTQVTIWQHTKCHGSFKKETSVASN